MTEPDQASSVTPSADRPIAFFDLDLTLLTINSAHRWVRDEWKLGWISHRQLLRAAWLLTRYRLGATSLESALRDAIMSLKGQREDDLKERVEHFYEREVRHAFRPGSLEVIESHRAQGHRCYLMTSASSYLSELVVAQLGLDGGLAQRFEVEDGVFTGASRGALCFGSGKLTHAEALISHSLITLQDCAFYTDSFSDVPLLEAVGAPRVVHPDPKLARYARTQKWPILTW